MKYLYNWIMSNFYTHIFCEKYCIFNAIYLLQRRKKSTPDVTLSGFGIVKFANSYKLDYVKLLHAYILRKYCIFNAIYLLQHRK